MNNFWRKLETRSARSMSIKKLLAYNSVKVTVRHLRHITCTHLVSVDVYLHASCEPISTYAYLIKILNKPQVVGLRCLPVLPETTQMCVHRCVCDLAKRHFEMLPMHWPQPMKITPPCADWPTVRVDLSAELGEGIHRAHWQWDGELG